MLLRRRQQPPASLLTLTAVFFMVDICQGGYFGGDMTSCSSDAVPYLLSVSGTGHPEISCEASACFLPSAHQRRPFVAKNGASKESNSLLNDSSEYFDDGMNSEEGRWMDERHRHNLDGENSAELLDNSVNRGSKRWRNRRAQQKTALPSSSTDAYDRSADDSSREEDLDYFINDDGAALRRRFVRAAPPATSSIAECDAMLTESACAASGEWTGAVAEWNNGTHISLRMSCCRYAGLRDGSLPVVELKSVELRAGQHYRGGTVLDSGGHAVAFDLLKEVRKNVTEANEVVYIVKVFRIGCSKSVEDNGRSRADDFFADNRESALQANRLQPSASMVRIAMSKRQSAPSSSRSDYLHPHTYLQQVRLAAAKAASRRPKFHRFPYYRRPLDDSASTSSADSDRSNAENDVDGDVSHESGERGGFTSFSSNTEKRRHPSFNNAVTRSSLPITIADAPPTPPPTSRTATSYGFQRRMPSPPFKQSQELGGDSSSSTRRRFQQYQLQQRARARNATAGAPPKRPLAPPTVLPSLSSASSTATSDYADATLRRSGTGRRILPRRGKVQPQKEEHGQTSASNEQLWPLRFIALNGAEQRLRQYAAATNEESGSSTRDDATGAPSAFDAEEEQNNLRATDEEYQLAENAASAGTGLVPPTTNLASNNEQQSQETDQQHLQEQTQFLAQPPPQILTDELTQSSLPVFQQGGYPTYLPQPPPPTQLLSSNGIYDNGASSYQAPPAGLPPSVDYQQQHYVVEQQQQCSSTCTGSTPTYCSAGGSGRCCCNNFNAGLNNLFSSLQCFSGDQLVRTRDGHKRMDELRVGDLVLSIDQSMITYSPIVMFLHRKPSERAAFLRVETQSAHRITMTDFHLIYASSGVCEPGGGAPIRLVAARHLRVGDCVQVMSDADRRLLPTRVTRIDTVEDVGIYAPLTASGDIFVGEVLASCHSNFAAQTLQQTFFAAWRSVGAWAHRVRRVAVDWLGERNMLLGWWHFRNSHLAEEQPVRCEQTTRWKNGTLSVADVPGEWTKCEHGLEQRMLKWHDAPREDEDSITEIPFGVEYLVGMLEIFVPISGF